MGQKMTPADFLTCPWRRCVAWMRDYAKSGSAPITAGRHCKHFGISGQPARQAADLAKEDVCGEGLNRPGEDKGFVSQFDSSRSKQIVVDAMMRLGHARQIGVIAVDVEAVNEMSVFQHLLCRQAQRSCFGQLMAEADFLASAGRDPPAVSQPEVVAPPAAADGKTRLALVVDDDKLVRETLSDMLELLGWSVTAAATAEEALAIPAMGQPPAVMITDVNLGADMDGFELCTAARTRWPQVGIVVISGRPPSRLQIDGLGHREVFLLKPVTLSVLEVAVNRVINGIDETGKRQPHVDVPPDVEDRAAGEPLNVADELASVASHFYDCAKARNIGLITGVQPDLWLRAEPETMRDAVAAILSGAFNVAADGKILMTAERRQDRVAIIVSDDAVVTDPGRRDDALWPVRQRVAVQDGSLAVEALKEKGTRVTLVLPGASRRT